MIGNHYGSLIDNSGHFTLHRARSDPSLPLNTIAENEKVLQGNCRFRNGYLTIFFYLSYMTGRERYAFFLTCERHQIKLKTNS